MPGVSVLGGLRKLGDMTKEVRLDLRPFSFPSRKNQPAAQLDYVQRLSRKSAITLR